MTDSEAAGEAGAGGEEVVSSAFVLDLCRRLLTRCALRVFVSVRWFIMRREYQTKTKSESFGVGQPSCALCGSADVWPAREVGGLPDDAFEVRRFSAAMTNTVFRVTARVPGTRPVIVRVFGRGADTIGALGQSACLCEGSVRWLSRSLAR